MLRNVEGGSLAARLLYPNLRQTSPENLPELPIIGADVYSASSATTLGPLAAGLGSAYLIREERVADSGAIRVRAGDQRRGRDRGA